MAVAPRPGRSCLFNTCITYIVVSASRWAACRRKEHIRFAHLIYDVRGKGGEEYERMQTLKGQSNRW